MFFLTQKILSAENTQVLSPHLGQAEKRYGTFETTIENKNIMNNVYHFPPDLFELILQTIPLLNRSKKSVLTFFNGAGVDYQIYKDISIKVNTTPDAISKYDIC